jgi:hypothetical protein
VEVFKTELQLVVIQPFGAPTKLTALQLLYDEPERSISACASVRLARSVASVRTIRCSVSTLSGRSRREVWPWREASDVASETSDDLA